MPVERRTEGVGLALWWTRQRDRNYLRKRGGGRPLGPGMEGPRVEPGKPEGRRSSLSGGGNRKERPCTRLERASGDSNRRILKTVRPVVWEGAGAQSPAPDPIRGFGRRVGPSGAAGVEKSGSLAGPRLSTTVVGGTCQAKANEYSSAFSMKNRILRNRSNSGAG